jgi:hypothetical protein
MHSHKHLTCITYYMLTLPRYERMPEVSRLVCAIRGKLGNTSLMSPKRQKDTAMSSKTGLTSLTGKLLSDSAAVRRVAGSGRTGVKKRWVKEIPDLKRRTVIMNKNLKGNVEPVVDKKRRAARGGEYFRGGGGDDRTPVKRMKFGGGLGAGEVEVLVEATPMGDRTMDDLVMATPN